MQTYRQTEHLYDRRSRTTAALQRAVRKLTARQRREAIARGATMPIGPRQELQRAVAEIAAAAVADALGVSR